MICPTCKERLTAKNGPIIVHKGLPHCYECGAELEYGEIGPPPRPMFNAGRFGSLLEETKPLQDNAIRCLEG